MGDINPPFYLDKMKEKKFEHIPKHVAIIMDGNGRWAQKRKMVRIQGHFEGMKRVEEIIKSANGLGIGALTLFTFSTENWNRPQAEVFMLMNALAALMLKKKKMLINRDIQFCTIGRKNRLPENVIASINEVTSATKQCKGMVLNLALDYGSRMEIEDAIRSIAGKVKEGKLELNAIDEEQISKAMYTKNLPDPDLLIRTSGEKRLSNFLLWQLSYAELYFTEKYWPDFTAEELEKAIIDFNKRDRRFGALKKKEGIDEQG